MDGRARVGASRAAVTASLCTAMLLLPARAEADEGAPIGSEQLGKWLDERPTEKADLGPPEAPDEAPPPPPPKHGFVIEATAGALGHLGLMRHISPTAPWLRGLIGYEVFKWVMVLAESDLSWTDTSYARPPPGPRTYALYGFGAGVRFTLRPAERFGIHVQGSVGTSRVSDDVLETYGYRDAHHFAPYFGATLGFEWYQTSPHYALVATGGVRNYSAGFDRQRSAASALAWTGGLALRYVL